MKKGQRKKVQKTINSSRGRNKAKLSTISLGSFPPPPLLGLCMDSCDSDVFNSGFLHFAYNSFFNYHTDSHAAGAMCTELLLFLGKEEKNFLSSQECVLSFGDHRHFP